MLHTTWGSSLFHWDGDVGQNRRTAGHHWVKLEPIPLASAAQRHQLLLVLSKRQILHSLLVQAVLWLRHRLTDRFSLAGVAGHRLLLLCMLFLTHKLPLVVLPLKMPAFDFLVTRSCGRLLWPSVCSIHLTTSHHQS